MTRYFLDTSALVKHYHNELGTDAVDRFIGEAGAELLIARLTLVETISVFAIKEQSRYNFPVFLRYDNRHLALGSASRRAL